MKKFFGLLIMLMMISSNSLAMTFSQPVELGKILTPEPTNGVVIENATYNSGKITDKYKNKNAYSNGIAYWGNGKNAIYLHYSRFPMKFGGKNENNAVSFSAPYGCTIYTIQNDGSITLYMLKEYGYMGESYSLFGKRPDGIWVKYVDTGSEYMQKNYSLKRCQFDKVYCQNDIIIMTYKTVINKQLRNAGEFRFKWDDAAQWFGVEHVKY